ncbi:MAG: TetR/AcrR family transcriptional regulator [Archangium sp.]
MSRLIALESCHCQDDVRRRGMAARKKPQSRYHHGDLKTALLESAWTVVARRGLEELSLRAVADGLGVSHSAPAHHFSDKGALVAALKVEAWRRFADALQPSVSKGLRALGRAYLRFARANPRQVQLMFSGGEENEHGARAWSALRSCVERSLPSGTRSEAELDALARAAWATVHGLATLPGEPVERVDERVLDVIEAGLSGVS